MAITVLIVDDQASFRGALRDLVAATEEFVLVGEAATGEAATGEAAVEAVENTSPRLVIMDKRMPGLSGIDAARVITGDHTWVVVILTSVEDVPNPQVLRSCGAAAFVRKQELSPATLRGLWAEHRG